MPPSHTTSLPLSLALREAGYKQEDASFYWCKPKESNDLVLWHFEKLCTFEYETKDWDQVAAPLASEILEEMPKHVKGHVLQICPGFKEGGWFAGYGDHMNLNGFLVEDGDTLCDALASLWLHINSQKII